MNTTWPDIGPKGFPLIEAKNKVAEEFCEEVEQIFRRDSRTTQRSPILFATSNIMDSSWERFVLILYQASNLARTQYDDPLLCIMIKETSQVYGKCLPYIWPKLIELNILEDEPVEDAIITIVNSRDKKISYRRRSNSMVNFTKKSRSGQPVST